MLFGLPSLRIKGFYLAVATLAAQFFLDWCFVRIPWLINYNASGAIEVPTAHDLGIVAHRPDRDAVDPLLRLLALVALLDLARLEPGPRADRPHLDGDPRHGHRGRDHRHPACCGQAARPSPSRSFFGGVAGALMVFVHLGAASRAFAIDMSFRMLFMVIIGGLGSILGAFLGAAFITMLPILLRAGPARWAAALAPRRSRT